MAMKETTGNYILEIENLTKVYKVSVNQFGGKKKELKAVNNVSFDVQRGETLGIVGESGCGKSTLGKMILRLIEPTSGSVKFDGMDVIQAKGIELKKIREEMQIVFQDPYASLNPRMNINSIIGEPLEIAGKKAEKEKRVLELIEQVGLHKRDLNRFPYEFSGGQRQRICIARAIALYPKLLICDEPVSALDVSVQSQILNLFYDLKKKMNLTYIFISHDLSVVQHISDRICVMYLGNVVEMGTTEEIFTHPMHPYTQCLMSAILKPKPHSRSDTLISLKGEITGNETETEGCPFYSRCPKALKQCQNESPNEININNRHMVRCHLCIS